MNDDTPVVTTWCGQDIRELTRDELIEALTQSVWAYHEHLQSSISSWKTMREIQAARRKLS